VSGRPTGPSTSASEGAPAGPPRVAYVAFPTLHATPLTVAAQLRLPSHAPGPLPAVVIVHGSAGVDGRGAALAAALNAAGMATLEVDLWSPRNLAGALSRPEHAAETLPDAFGALRYLAGRAEIDGRRVGVAGFSWGGVVSMLTATRHYAERIAGEGGERFAGHAPFYPVCWAYNRRPGYEFRDLTGAPVLLQAGALDAYDRPTACTELVAGLPESDRRHVRVIVYEGATHAFDRPGPAVTVVDPHAHEGAGGEVTFTPNPEVTARAHAETVAFFREALGSGS
jgi:dienelactone hydrolase